MVCGSVTIFDIQRPCPDARLKVFDLATQLFKTLRLDSFMFEKQMLIEQPKRTTQARRIGEYTLQNREVF
jgi:hypothetical protein